MSEGGDGEGKIVSIPAKSKEMGLLETTFLMFGSFTLVLLAVVLPVISAVIVVRKYKEYGLALVIIVATLAAAFGVFTKVYLLTALCTAYFIPYFLVRLNVRGLNSW